MDQATHSRFITRTGLGSQSLVASEPAPNNDSAEKIKILIFGSCVTRDVFRIDDTNVIISDYFARQSITSSVAEPHKIDSKNIGLDSNFQKNMVMRDFDKTYWETMKKTSFDYLLIDLIDERFNLIKLDNTIVTKSSELVKSGLLTKIGKYKELPRNRYPLEQWMSDCNKFCERVLERIGVRKIIIIKAFWAAKYLDNEGRINQFSDDKGFNALTIADANKRLESYYAYLIDNLPGVNVVEIDDPIADARHAWGLSPFHYVENRYRGCKAELEKIFYCLKGTTSTSPELQESQ